MAHICYECKLGYGHALYWCPGCGRRMIKVKQVEWDKLRENNWKLEGDKDLFEYFIDGVSLAPNLDRYDTLVDTIINKYPEVWKLFNINYKPKGPTPIGLKWVHGERSCYVHLDNGILSFYFKKPVLTWRLKGSNLSINFDEIDMFKEQEFKGV